MLADAVEPGERLDGDVGEAEQHARRAAEHDAVVVVRGAEAGAGDQQRADREHRGLEGDHARQRVAGVRAARGRQRDDEEEEAAGGHADADPLAGADLEAEQPLGHHGEDHDAGGEHRLDDRERGVGEGGDVEEPGAGGDGHADREPLRGEELLDRAQRMAHVDLRRLVGPPVLVQEAKLRHDGANKRQQYAQVHHSVWKSICRARHGDYGAGVALRMAPMAMPVSLSIGTQGPRLESHSD